MKKLIVVLVVAVLAIAGIAYAQRANIVEKTNDEVIAESTSKVFRHVYARSPAIPARYDGQYALLAIITTPTNATEAQMDAFEDAVEGLTGVDTCFILIGPSRIPLDRVPTGHDLFIGVEGSYRIEPEPVE